MTLITPISGNLLQPYLQSKPVNTEPAPKVDVPTAPATEVVKKETADALKAYSLVDKKPKCYEKNNLEDLAKDFVSKGKVEGKDFTIERDKVSSKLTLLENEKPVKIFYYNGTGASEKDFDLVQEIEYPASDDKGLISIETTYGADGEFHFRTMNYDKDKSPYQNDIVNNSTKSSEFRQFLKDNNMKFTSDLDCSDGIDTHKFTVFDPNSNYIFKYEFVEDQDGKPVFVSKSEISGNDTIERSIAFMNEQTSVTEYEDKSKN